MSDRSH